jgi:hypothetical protein
MRLWFFLRPVRLCDTIWDLDTSWYFGILHDTLGFQDTLWYFKQLQVSHETSWYFKSPMRIRDTFLTYIRSRCSVVFPFPFFPCPCPFRVRKVISVWSYLTVAERDITLLFFSSVTLRVVHSGSPLLVRSTYCRCCWSLVQVSSFNFFEHCHGCDIDDFDRLPVWVSSTLGERVTWRGAVWLVGVERQFIFVSTSGICFSKPCNMIGCHVFVGSIYEMSFQCDV